MMLCLVNIRRKEYLVTEAHGQLVEGHGVRTVGSEENLELDELVNMETGRLELGLTLNWSQRERERGETCSYTLRTIITTYYSPHWERVPQ